MKTPNGKYSCKNGYLQIVIHRGRASACGEKFTVMTACNTFGKRPCGWGAQKPCVIRAEARIDFTSLTRSVFTCSKRLLFEQPYYRKFTVTCGCNPILTKNMVPAVRSWGAVHQATCLWMSIPVSCYQHAAAAMLIFVSGYAAAARFRILHPCHRSPRNVHTGCPSSST